MRFGDIERRSLLINEHVRLIGIPENTRIVISSTADHRWSGSLIGIILRLIGIVVLSTTRMDGLLTRGILLVLLDGLYM